MSRFGYCKTCEFCNALWDSVDERAQCAITKEIFCLELEAIHTTPAQNRKCTLSYEQRKEVQELFPQN